MEKVEAGKLEWTINMDDGRLERLSPGSSLSNKRVILWLKGMVLKSLRFIEKVWRIGADDPRKVIHCLKVGLALSLVSLFYYMRPLYDGVGKNAMWAIMTVVVVFESNVGATFSKCINRVVATALAGSLGIGVHWIATHSGEIKPLVIGISVFIFASAATFSRFVPSFKARFDYGAMIFILTFSFVSVSGFRVDNELVELAQQRASTIAIGTSICVFISMFFCPIWAGAELHNLLRRNLEKLADSLEGCVEEYFKNSGIVREKDDEEMNKKIQGFKCVLNSKGAEESMANFARWEPSHGSFNFRHPWNQYLKLGTSMRRCAYCLENLSSCIKSETQAPVQVKTNVKETCQKLCSASSKILRESVIMMKHVRKSSKMEILVLEMNSVMQKLKETLASVPEQTNMGPEVSAQDNGDDESRTVSMNLYEVLSLATLVSLLIENAARVEEIAKAVDELASQAKFKSDSKKKTKTRINTVQDI